MCAACRDQRADGTEVNLHRVGIAAIAFLLGTDLA
jgi:hypothetical protein